MPAFSAAPEEPAVRLAQRLAASRQTTLVAFGTEAGFLSELGIPTVVCGPGSMVDQGHKPDEYISQAQLLKCSKMLARAVNHLL